MVYPLNFNTAYRQFYLTDKVYDHIASAEFWTDEAYQSRLALSEGIVGIGIECYGPVKGELVILENNHAQIEYEKYDHIVEGGLEMSSGILQVLDCPNCHVELELKLNPGKYRIRVYSSNLNSVEGDEGDDFYKIEIWPDQDRERKVIKQYKR